VHCYIKGIPLESLISGEQIKPLQPAIFKLTNQNNNNTRKKKFASPKEKRKKERKK
jgi:hypothetical protein